MAKINERIKKCWLSPDGEIIYCGADHGMTARKIISSRYPNDVQKSNEDSRDFLHKKGWARFCDVLWAITGSGWVIPRHLTTDQKNKIFELTNEWFET